MTVISASGITEPFSGPRPYPSFGTRTPALHGFRLTYADARDRELTLIQVLPGGASTDLTPTADLTPANFAEGDLHVALQDANPSGEDFGYRVAHNLLNLPGSRRFQMRDLGCVEKCVRTLPRQVFSSSRFFAAERRTLALTGFKIFFTGARDRDIKAIGVWFENNELHVELRDRTGGEVFGYLVDFVSIPTTQLQASTLVLDGSGTALDSDNFSLPGRGEPFLSGWRFEFQGNVDEELLDIGAQINGNTLNVFFGDQGGGDAFNWQVWLSHVSPIVFAQA